MRTLIIALGLFLSLTSTLAQGKFTLKSNYYKIQKIGEEEQEYQSTGNPVYIIFSPEEHKVYIDCDNKTELLIPGKFEETNIAGREVIYQKFVDQDKDMGIFYMFKGETNEIAIGYKDFVVFYLIED